MNSLIHFVKKNDVIYSDLFFNDHPNDRWYPDIDCFVYNTSNGLQVLFFQHKINGRGELELKLSPGSFCIVPKSPKTKKDLLGQPSRAVQTRELPSLHHTSVASSPSLPAPRARRAGPGPRSCDPSPAPRTRAPCSRAPVRPRQAVTGRDQKRGSQPQRTNR